LSLYSRVWFNTPRLAAALIWLDLLKFGNKPDGIINFLSNEPPLKKGAAKDTAGLAPRRLIGLYRAGREIFPLHLPVEPAYGACVSSGGEFQNRSEGRNFPTGPAYGDQEGSSAALGEGEDACVSGAGRSAGAVIRGGSLSGC
jgi:hypothetical protein